MITASMIRPFIALICLVLLSVFHIEIGDSVQVQAAELIVGAYTLVETIVGIVKNHK